MYDEVLADKVAVVAFGVSVESINTTIGSPAFSGGSTSIDYSPVAKVQEVVAVAPPLTDTPMIRELTEQS